MGVNTMTFEQSAAFLTALYEQATGQTPTIAVTDTGKFTTVGTTLLQGGYDPIISAITQVLDRTIFSMRVYNKKFEDLSVDEIRFGAVTRKINYLDNDLDAVDDRLTLTDGQAVDPYVVKKPKVLQTNFYGAHQYQDSITIFRDQLDSALRDAAMFGEFISNLMTHISNRHKQIEEALARSILANFITAKSLADNGNVINVLQEYYNETGVTLTPANMFAVANYDNFTRWLAGYLTTLMEKMAERSTKYHMNIAGKEVMRFTEGDAMRKYISANVANYLETMVKTGAYNPDKLNSIVDGMKKVTFWQNIDDPYKVMATPSYLNTTDGTITTATNAETVSGIVGALFDRDALGMVKRSTWSGSTPFNPRGGYYNIFWHWTQTTWNDFTENFVVLVADTVTP